MKATVVLPSSEKTSEVLLELNVSDTVKNSAKYISRFFVHCFGRVDLIKAVTMMIMVDAFFWVLGNFIGRSYALYLIPVNEAIVLQ